MNKSVSPGGNTNEAAGTCFVFLRLRELIAVIVDFRFAIFDLCVSDKSKIANQKSKIAPNVVLKMQAVH